MNSMDWLNHSNESAITLTIGGNMHLPEPLFRTVIDKRSFHMGWSAGHHMMPQAALGEPA